MEPFAIFGVLSGIMFLVFLTCVIAQICIKKRMSERYRPQSIYTTVAGSNVVSNINTQFNNPVAGPRPTFAPAANYPMDPGYHYPANPPPQFDQQHHQNFNSRAASTYMPMPMMQPDVPPSYSQVIGRSQ